MSSVFSFSCSGSPLDLHSFPTRRSSDLPQLQNATVERHIEGIDIVMSIDISSSMLAEDFEPNRLLAAKNIAADVIEGRVGDGLGLIVFARQCFIVYAFTSYHRLMLELI